MSDAAPAPLRIVRSELPTKFRDLLAAAEAARGRARATYSGYRVGAAALDSQNRVHAGCNVEISSYPLSLCAERVALFAAIAAGAESIEAIAVVGPGHGGDPTPPCGACRQVIWDLAGDIPVLLGSPDGTVQQWQSRALLPSPFGPDHLEDDR